MIVCRTPMEPSQLWDFDWYAAALPLEPADEFMSSMIRTAAKLAKGGHCVDTVPFKDLCFESAPCQAM